MIKEKTIDKLYKDEIIRNSIFFVVMTAFMVYVLWSNLNNTSDNAGLVLLIALLISFCSCFFEMRIVRQNGKFLFPNARMIMFLSKPLMLVVCYFVTILTFKSTIDVSLKYLLLILTIILMTGLYYIGIIMIFRKKDKNEVCYIDYTLSKLIKSKNRNSALIGIITTSILLLGIVVGFIVCLVTQKFNNYTIVGFIITTCLMVGCEVFYIIDLIKAKKNNFK